MASKKSAVVSDGISVPVPVMTKLVEIHEAPYNPRIMPKERMAALKASVAKHGMVLNLVVQKRSKEYKMDNVLIGGHQRLKAMRELSKERGHEPPAELPCVFMDVDDATAKQMNVALNRIEGEFDHYKVGEMFSGMLKDMTTDDILATGFDAIQIEQMVTLVLPPDEQIEAIEDEMAQLPPEFEKRPAFALEFKVAASRAEFKELAKKMAESTKKLPGDAVLAAVKLWLAGQQKPTKKK